MDKEHTKDPAKQADNAAGINSFMDIVAREAEEYAADHTTPMSALLEEVEYFTITSTPYPNMLTGRVEGRFLQIVAQLSRARISPSYSCTSDSENLKNLSPRGVRLIFRLPILSNSWQSTLI